MTTTTQDTAVSDGRQPQCPECGYDLRGQPPDSGRCPECGLVIDAMAPAESRVPWVHRRRIGILRAYLRTVLLVSLRPHRFAEEVVRPAPLDGARLFQFITLLFVLAPLAVLATFASPFDARWLESAARDIGNGTPSLEAWAAPAMYGAEPAAVRVACVAIGLFAVAGVGGRIIRWGAGGGSADRGEGVRVLARYTGAPLLALPALFVLVPAALLILRHNLLVMAGVGLGAYVVLALAVVEWWWVHVLIVRRAARSTGRALAAAVALPVTGALLAALTCFLIPWLIGCVLILAASFG